MAERSPHHRSDPQLKGEGDRQAVVSSYPVNDEALRCRLDQLAQLAARLCDTPVGLVSLVEAERQVFLGKSGTSLAETPREVSFCAHAMLGTEVMVIPDATADVRFRDNSLVTGDPGIRFYAGMPLRAPDATPLGSLCVFDTKPRDNLSKDALETLRTLGMAAMAVLNQSRAEHDGRVMADANRQQAVENERRFETLADAMPLLVWSTDAEGKADYFNRGWLEYTGQPAEASYGAGWLEFLHPQDRPLAMERWSEAVEEDTGYNIEYRLRNGDGDYRWMLVRAAPMRDDAGTIVRWFGTCTDIHDQRQSAELLQLLTRELDHRIKNIFAVISGLISFTMRQSPEFEPAGIDLQQRVLALGRAHDFVRTRAVESTGARTVASLHDLLTEVLRPYADASGERVRIVGEDIAIDDRSATPLALFIHEMATNAAKYGALSDGRGSVEITIGTSPQDVSIVWRESGGPRVTYSDKSGFGASLIDLSISRQLDGRLEYEWRDEGLRVTAMIPRATMSR